MKIIFFILLGYLCILPHSFSSEIIDCNQFDKLSAKYVECKTKNLKTTLNENQSKAKKKIAVSKESIKSQIDQSETKKKFDSSKFKERLIKFKNSKTMSEFINKNDN